jgi:hypothetical protein
LGAGYLYVIQRVQQEREMNAATDTQTTKLGAFPYVTAGLSFVPLIGVLFGVISIIWGLVTKKAGGKKLVVIGACGIGFTIVLYGSLFYFGFVQRGGVYDDLRTKLAQSTLNSAVPAIEFYRVQNGKYPESLEVLQKSLPKESFVLLSDPTFVGFGAKPTYFYYEWVGEDHYYLRGIGADRKPFTADDIVPQVTDGGNVGLLIERQVTQAK